MKKEIKQKNMICPMKLQPGGGFTLVETLVAISIFSFSVLALSAVLSNGISQTDYAQKKIQAGYLAQEGIEFVRNVRDYYVVIGTDKWNSFSLNLAPCNSSGKCSYNDSLLPDNEKAIINDCANGDCVDENGFERYIWAENIGSGDEIKIYSQVKWTQGSGTYEITLTENLFDWQED